VPPAEGSQQAELYELLEQEKTCERLIHKTDLQRRLDLRKRIFLMIWFLKSNADGCCLRNFF